MINLIRICALLSTMMLIMFYGVGFRGIMKKLDLSRVRIFSNTKDDARDAIDLIGEEVYLSDDASFSSYNKGNLIEVSFSNEYSYLFDSTRLKPIKNIDEFKNMIVESTNSLILNKLRSAQMNFDEIANNSGSIIEVNNEKVGIYKSPDGKIYAVKPICTHLGCLLSWNEDPCVAS